VDQSGSVAAPKDPSGTVGGAVDVVSNGTPTYLKTQGSFTEPLIHGKY
jgi:hypothetical protein